MSLPLERPWLAHYPEGVRPQLEYPDQPLHHLLDETAARMPHAPAILFYGRRLTWHEVRRAADAFAVALQELGVRPGDRVAIMMPNVPQGVIAYWGTLKAGALVVFFNPLYVEREIEHQLKDSGAEIMVVLDLLYEKVRAVMDRTHLRKVIVTPIRAYMGLALKLLVPLVKRELVARVPAEPHVLSLQSLLRQYDGRAPAPLAVNPATDVAVLQYTGGTTGLSKGAMLTHRNLVANVHQVREWMPGLVDGGERMLAVMPFFHVYGLTCCLHLGTLIGATLLLVPKFDLKQVLGLIDKEKPTLFPGAPPIYVAINHCKDLARYNLRSVKACISGAAALPVEVQRQFEQLTGGKLVEGYGLTEASPVTHCTPVYGRRVPGSIGLPLPDTEMMVVDLETGTTPVAPGEQGELCIRGPQVMAGYWNRPEEMARTVRDGWLHTGDIVTVDKAGYTFVVDRIKDLIIASGYNIVPREVEEVLYEHPAVMDAVVVGVPDEYRGQTVKAYIVLKPGESLTADDLIAYCRERLARFKVPTLVEFRGSLPKTMIGKVLRRVLLEEEQQRLGAPGP
ncbi:MAG TPA: long-chain fatty acid--CoA ligase [Symbiobacteriaceae bacterium]|nr:long-chain fatty acid--CoA ligase [Symbiobacteriaceae bacterium]